LIVVIIAKDSSEAEIKVASLLASCGSIDFLTGRIKGINLNQEVYFLYFINVPKNMIWLVNTCRSDIVTIFVSNINLSPLDIECQQIENYCIDNDGTLVNSKVSISVFLSFISIIYLTIEEKYQSSFSKYLKIFLPSWVRDCY